jgi:protein SCO1/2
MTLLVIVLLVVAFIIVAEYLRQQQIAETSQHGYPGLGGDFTLQSADGPVSLKDYRGKVVVLFFGFASCPDVCPNTLGVLSLAMGKLSAGDLADVQGLFISVDPERDSVEVLQEYVKAFHSNIQGITGTPDEIRDVAKRYGVFYRKVEMPDSALEYTMEHAAIMYVIGRDGVVKSLLRHGAGVDEVADTLSEALQ